MKQSRNEKTVHVRGLPWQAKALPSLVRDRTHMRIMKPWPKTQNIKQKQYCNKLIKTFKMVHIKKKSLRKKENHFRKYMLGLILLKE